MAGVARSVLEDPINQYDPLLGWKHIPNKIVPMNSAFPGEDIVFQINANGFRGTNDFTLSRPPGMTRLIAVGDSFTFGNVKYEHAWPAQLEQLNPRLQVINMGASAYGLDQMYLWYKEDGSKFNADIVICAVIEEDFARVFLHKWPSGHGRPRFVLANGELALTNVPVPKRIEAQRPNIHPREFLDFLNYRLRPRKDHVLGSRDIALPMTILRTFRQYVTSRKAGFLLVYLPVQRDFEAVNPFRAFLRTYCQEHEIAYLDITDELRRRKAEHQVEVFRTDGHYNIQGNRLAAAIIYEYLSTSNSLSL